MISVEWKPTTHVLKPEAVLIPRARVASSLGTLQERALYGVVTPEALALLSVGEEAPWLPGIAYFGRSEADRLLYLPTALNPQVPVSLLSAAVRRHYMSKHQGSERGGALLLSPAGYFSPQGQLIGLSEADEIDPERLKLWAEGRADG